MAAGIAIERTDEAQRQSAARLAAMPAAEEWDADRLIAELVTFDDEIDMEGIEIPVTFGDEE